MINNKARGIEQQDQCWQTDTKVVGQETRGTTGDTEDKLVLNDQRSLSVQQIKQQARVKNGGSKGHDKRRDTQHCYEESVDSASEGASQNAYQDGFPSREAMIVHEYSHHYGSKCANRSD